MGEKDSVMGISEQFLKKWIKRIKPQYYAAFFGALIVGFICHMPVMTKNLPVYDTFWNIYFDQDMISSGRQFLTFACGPTSYYNLPWINGIVSLIFLALTAVCFTELFRLERKSTAFLTGAVIAAFPAVTGTFAFIYTADGYMMAFFLSVLCVLLADRLKWGFIPGAFLCGFSIGVYQSYLSVTMLLCIFILVGDLLKSDRNWKEILYKALRFLGTGAFGYLFYVLSLKIMLALSGRSLSGYQGTDRVGGIELSGLLTGLKSAFTDFREFTFSGGIFTENIWMKIAYVLFILTAAGLFCYTAWKEKLYQKPVRILCIVLLLALIPFAASAVCIISPGVLFHILMRMPWVVLFLFGLSFMDGKKAFGLIGFLFAGILVFNFILSANVVYFNLNERYEKTYALCIRIADRLEQTEGYQTGDPVAILGGYPNAEYYPSTDITEKITRGYHETEGDYCIESSEKYAEFMKHYLNVTVQVPEFDEQLAIADTDEFRQMDCFPKDGCIKKIRGVWVVKLNG